MFAGLFLLLPPLAWGGDAADDETDVDGAAPQVLIRETAPASDALHPQLDLEAGLGMLLHSDGLGAAARLQVGAGWTLPALDGRVRLGSELGFSRPTASGSLIDPRAEETVSWRLGVNQLDIGASAALSVVGDHPDLDAELLVMPRLVLVHTRMRADGSSEVLGRARETAIRPGLMVGGGVVGPVGSGEVAMHLGVSILDLDGVVTGSATPAAFFALFRFRHVMTERNWRG
jgi:hypothetical protein